MKKEELKVYMKPDIKTINMSPLDVITTSGGDEQGSVIIDDNGWTPYFD